MHCPFCQHENTRVVDSRVIDDGAMIRRRRACEACGERFSTLESADIKLPDVVKSNGNRESFDPGKLRKSFRRALEKRPVSVEDVDAAVRRVVRKLRMSGEREVPSRQIGEHVMTELKALDQVAYVRFASVYRSFQDVQAFREEIERLEKEVPELERYQLSLLSPGLSEQAERQEKTPPSTKADPKP